MRTRISVAVVILLLAVINLYAQSKIVNYTKEWKQIDLFRKKKLPKSALSLINVVYTQAKKDHNETQLIKTLLYKIMLTSETEEGATSENIREIRKEIIRANEPARSIYYSILAEVYEYTLAQGRNQIYSLTNTSNFKQEDVNTWTIDDYTRMISECYNRSIKNEQLLKQTRLNKYEPIIIKGNTRVLRPSLYDLLTHRALDYFKNDERDVNKPSYYFEIKDKKAFAPCHEFAQHKFINKDSMSLYFQAILIFQQLIRLHINDIQPQALIDVDIERLNFMKEKAVMENKSELYIIALKRLQQTYKNVKASAQAGYLIARQVYDLAGNEESNIHSKIYSVKKAKEIADAVAKHFPNSEGGISARNLANEILQKELKINIEKVNVPGLAMRCLITYKNFYRLNLRVIAIKPGQEEDLSDENADSTWIKLISKKTIRSWSQILPVTHDYLSHSAEIKVNSLPIGKYAIIASNGPRFKINKNHLSSIYFYVSNISEVNFQNKYFILNRETGQPLAGAKVQEWLVDDENTVSKNKESKGQVLIANDHGYVEIAPIKHQDSESRLEITFQNDRLKMEDQLSLNRSTDEDEGNTSAYEYEHKNAKVFLFTDRSIYRPGQVIYFKGICITNDFTSRRCKLYFNKKPVKVFLKDANWLIVDSIELVQNEYGSFNGKFTLPEKKLNGEYTIEVVSLNNSQKSFNVEEYKRPKFYVEFEKLKGIYQLNEKVKITGSAKAYAGNDVEGARLSYTVTRQTRFLYNWIWQKWGMPHPGTMEIAHGETTTNTEGKFNIEFNAIPDLYLNKNTDPVFDYIVTADVTDINGETRSAKTTIPIGFKSLDLQLSLPKYAIPADSLNVIRLSTNNLAGEFKPSKVEVKIYNLLCPKRLIRKRYWPKPDLFVMTREMFLHLFPHDEYKDDLDKDTWERDKLVYRCIDSSSPGSTFKLKHLKLPQGWYLVEATSLDRFGKEVKDVQYVELYDINKPTLPFPEYSWTSKSNTTLEPGGEAKFISGSAANNLFVITEEEHPLENKAFSGGLNFEILNNEKKMYSFPVNEQDRGGFGIYRFFVKDNRFYSTAWVVNVPWSNKELDISFDTYRDKTLPGSEEKWKVKIKGKKGEKLGAEMLASMYDASLDQFTPQSWNLNDIWPSYIENISWSGDDNFISSTSEELDIEENVIPSKLKIYDQFITNMPFTSKSYMLSEENQGSFYSSQFTPPKAVNDEEVIKPPPIYDWFNNDTSKYKDKSTIIPDSHFPAIQIRKNFNETAFFYPELRTDEDGNMEFSFTMPEALTQWKLMLLAHTKDLAIGYAEKMVVTQKDLMVQPNPPRFLREGDKIEFTTKVVNLSDKPQDGQVELKLLDALSLKPVDGMFSNNQSLQNFNITAGHSTLIKYKLEIPSNYNNGVIYRLVAKAGNVSDGEEALIPVLTNRLLVTETMSLPLRGTDTKSFTFQKLVQAGQSRTLTNHRLTVEYTTNPAWNAIQSLPYLMEFPYECAEQTFNRYFANSIAASNINNAPKITSMFEKWKKDSTALLSSLQKNPELKSLLLEETPWVIDAQNESQQRKNIALLFDMAKMNSQLESAIEKLKNMQVSNGGFSWFNGGSDDRYITQYILTGIGHLTHLNLLLPSQQAEIKKIKDAALLYLDKKLKEDYEQLLKQKSKLNQDNLEEITIQYFYMRSFFPEYPIAKESQIAYNYYRDQQKKYWVNKGKYMEAMIALSLFRKNEAATSTDILKSLKETAINNEELGMYWKEWNSGGYYWYQAPIESQAMMIEAFSEIGKDIKVVDDLKTWLLKNKQTNNWHTTKATAEACYALLLQGTDWLAEDKNVTIKLGSTIINSKDENQEAGTGYFKKQIDGSRVTPDMGNISVTVSPVSKGNGNPSLQSNSSGASWGAVYWQYFENLDKITFSETPLKLNKKLFIEKNTDRGPVLTPIEEGTVVKVGDKIKVRIELRVDREMEYVHMKDMRASCMEPVNVLSEYKYQGGLGYYETTKDASTNFFFSWLPKGTYVFEYPMFVTHSGNFSNGITSIQCMYAPEFTAHSEGVRVIVTK